MAKNHTAILHNVSGEELSKIAESASKLLNVIRAWLPVAGDTGAKTTSSKTSGNWFSAAAKRYEECELIRNSDYVPFAGRGFVMERGYSFGVCTDVFPYWQTLLSTLDEIAVLYHWEGISDRSVLHGWNWWEEGASIPCIERNTLDRLERTILGLKSVAVEIKHSGFNGVRKSNAGGTQKKNSGKNNHAWDANAKKMATRYIAACKKDGKRLNRLDFIKEELLSNVDDFPNAREASTINQSLKIHSSKWKSRLDKALGKATEGE